MESAAREATVDEGGPVESLAEMSAPNFELDTRVSEVYQAFSAEIARISFLAVGGITALLLSQTPHTALTPKRVAALTAAALFALAAGLALAHRYYSAEALSSLLRFLRLKAANRLSTAKEEKSRYQSNLDWAGPILVGTCVCVVLGAAAFVVFLWF